MVNDFCSHLLQSLTQSKIIKDNRIKCVLGVSFQIWFNPKRNCRFASLKSGTNLGVSSEI